jgi:hypothetical protein
LGKATFDLTAAQQRATESFAKQSEFYNLYEEAMNEMNPDTLEKTMLRLQAEAEKFNWSDDVRTLMEEKLKAKFENQDKEKEKEPQERQNVTNKAIERGTMAYYNAQNNGQKPLLDESKRQTTLLASINKNLSNNENINIVTV